MRHYYFVRNEMIIYEVNLTIDNHIYREYYDWLVSHIRTILQFDGFIHAEVAKEKLADHPTNKTNMTVRYTLNTEKDLDNYLQNHAPAMRQDGIKRFGNQFNAQRRIFTEFSILKKD